MHSLASHAALSFLRAQSSMGSDEGGSALSGSLRDALGLWVLSTLSTKATVLTIDFHLTDCLGRSWQCGTIQLDLAAHNFQRVH